MQKMKLRKLTCLAGRQARRQIRIKKISRKFSLRTFNKLFKIVKENFPKTFSKLALENSIKKRIFYITYFGRKIVGFFILEKENNNLLLARIAVAKKFQGKGLGRSAMQRIISLAKKYKCKIIFLHVRKINKKAIKFYKHFNFKIIRLKKNFYKTGCKDAYQMNLNVY